MLFNSYSFIFLFLPITFCGMFFLGRHSHRLAALWLGVASLVFYGVWDARFVLLLVASIAFNYGAGYWIGLRHAAGAQRQAKLTLILAIAANLALLGYFKYANFFIAAIGQVLGKHYPALDLLLPLGISFFTFTQIAFLVDVHRGITREYNFIHYLLFVTYFPHLIAGPVLHHKQMMPQFANRETYRIHAEHIAVGLAIFVLGLAKKVLVADNVAAYASPAFAAAGAGHALTMLESWIGALAYTMQIYFDFSGYSDMALGLSLLFNIRLPINFDSPYKATSIIDFWRRWHISLSTFLRDYLYVPLGGNRHGKTRRYLNLMATMLLGGLWHGAGWTFIIWGGLHGFYLMLNHGWREWKTRRGWNDGGRLARWCSGTLTFVAVVIAWVFFRAESLPAAHTMLQGMSGLQGFMPHAWTPSREALKVIVPCMLLAWLFPNVRQMLIRYKPAWEDLAGKATPAPLPQGRLPNFLSWRPTPLRAIGMGLLFVWCLDSLTKVSEFLYFQF